MLPRESAKCGSKQVFSTLSSRLERALEVLDLVSSAKRTVDKQGSHARLIQSCLENLTNTKPSTEEYRKPVHSFDATSLSVFLSECGQEESVNFGLRLHAISVKSGNDRNCPVASSLISFYIRNEFLHKAHQLFDEISRRTTASWTAIIAGYAQKSRIKTAFILFNKMRRENSNPNDYTLSSLLSACGGFGCLQNGKLLHCHIIQRGFISYSLVSNALISMYAKCGCIEDGSSIFNQMVAKDTISWNSMISGHAQHGFAEKAMEMFDQMELANVLPDSITFLSVLSSCRHAGLVERALDCFNSMVKLGINPEVGHYSCIIDLLGRSGLFEEALDFIQQMSISIKPNAVIWGSLLSSSRVHGNTHVGITAAFERLLCEPTCAATHVQLANLHAAAGEWQRAAKIRKDMKERGVKTVPGYSWTEINGKVHVFRADDMANTHLTETILFLGSLFNHMRRSNQNPDVYTHQ